MPRFSPSVRRFSAAFAAVAFALGASMARADPLLPAFVEKHWEMPCTPQCTICHRDNSGGFNTLRTTTAGDPGMGMNLKAQLPDGLDPTDQGTWAPALDEAAQNKLDSDGDGTPDMLELTTGDPEGKGVPTDPDDPTPGAPLVCAEGATPSYGCARVSPRGPVDGVAGFASAAALAIGISLLRRRTR